MTGNGRRVRAVTRLAIVAGIGAVLFQVSGLPARAPEPAPPPSPPMAPAATPAANAEPAIPVAAAPPGALVIKRVLTLQKPLRHGDYAWDDAGVPAGRIVITVDLAAETLSVFRDGYEIGVAAVLYGAPDKPSPLGVFKITQKKVDHVSNLYDAPMPYMMRLTDDGVAIHGSEVIWNNATHGCIGVPTAFAKLLFAQARLGDSVIITNGKRIGVGAPIAAS